MLYGGGTMGFAGLSPSYEATQTASGESAAELAIGSWNETVRIGLPLQLFLEIGTRDADHGPGPIGDGFALQVHHACIR